MNKDSGSAGCIEVEVKLPVPDREELFRRLETCGFILKSVQQETDTYYNSGFYDLREQDKALRIRRVTDPSTGCVFAQMNCKGAKLDHVSMSRSEIEISIENAEGMEKLLAEISFYPVEYCVCKVRHTFVRGQITAAADRVEGLGDFLELEILAEDERRREGCLEEIAGVLRELGYEMRQTVRSSYLSMLEQKSRKICRNKEGDE